MPDLLPPELHHAYQQFSGQLHSLHGLTVRPLHYLRLNIDAQHLMESRDCSTLDLLISGHKVKCVFDHAAGPHGALTACHPPAPYIPPYRHRHKSDYVDAVTGIRRHKRFLLKKKVPYKRPCPGERDE